MAGMEPESFDAIVTDPPYGLEFMGKEWDRLDGQMTQPGIGSRPIEWPAFGDDFAGYNPTCATCGGRARGARKCECPEPDWRVKGQAIDASSKQGVMQQWHQRWATEALRVAKPGAYLLAFGGTRTVHRLTVALEDAGWIIRDLLVWAYASGFPKSKASLKPAWEPIVLARKPGPLQELAIDACRIGTETQWIGPAGNDGTEPVPIMRSRDDYEGHEVTGRWPANLILADPIFDGDTEGVVGGGETGPSAGGGRRNADKFGGGFAPPGVDDVGLGDTGTYSRFFLIPKASRSDREPVVPGGDEDDLSEGKKRTIPRRNTHPTVKPTELMRHLVRLVTPPLSEFVPDEARIAEYARTVDISAYTAGDDAMAFDEAAFRLDLARRRARDESLGAWRKREPTPVVLDPFLGSGSTALAAEMEGFAWVGIEREPEYVRIAEGRLVHAQKGLGL